MTSTHDALEPYTPIADIPTIHAALRATFRSGRTAPLAWRQHQLRQLARFLKENKDALAAALHADLRKPVLETTMGEIVPIYERALESAERLEAWCAPEDIREKGRGWQQGWGVRVERKAKGVVLIIAPWNYPIVLSLQPLYGAIAAGCCALLKLSELAPHYASFVARNLGKYVDPACFRVALGGVPEITAILELKWDHIFYTGNGRVARVIAAAAARHLTPLTLELGGKSPVIVDASADIPRTARRILWGKTTNCGQICVSPDYVLAERAIVPALVAALQATLKEFYPEGALESASYGRIVSDLHFERLKGLIGRTKGTVVAGGEMRAEERGIAPTVVMDVRAGDALLEGENFGPILPIITVDNIDGAIEYINDHDHPLVLYLFTTDEATKVKVLERTTSGNACINDTVNQLSLDHLPFGGVGESGYGRQVLYASFENFVYPRGVADIPYSEEPLFAARYAPYKPESVAFFAQGLDTPIPPTPSPAVAA